MRYSLSLMTSVAALIGSTIPVEAENLSVYGTPGLVDMPTAGSMDDGVLAYTITQDDVFRRQTGSFQITPRLTAAFRYTRIDGLVWVGEERSNFDRSFDLHYRLVDEGAIRPAVAIGLRDMIGTGLFSSEYVVATKTVAPGLRVTAGLGWGSLGERDGMTNPLGVFDSNLETRDGREVGDQGGTLQDQSWFAGDAAFFGGVSWQANDRLGLMVEYSSDLYELYERQGADEVSSPLNFGLRYSFGSRGSLSAHYLRGNTVGVSYSFAFDPHEPIYPSGLEGAPPDPGPRRGPPAAIVNSGDPETRLAAALAEQGMVFRGLTIDGNHAELRLNNSRWGAEAQAFGRAARVMAATLPGHIRSFDIVFMQHDLPITRIGIAREDIHDLEHDLEGDWRLLGRVEFGDAHDSPVQEAPVGMWPRTDISVSPFFEASLFDPDSPLLYDAGLQFNGRFRPAPGVTFSTILRYPLASTLEDATRRSDSVLPHVRSDYYRYVAESDLEVRQMTAEYLFRPGEAWFGRVSAGLLEPMFGGVSGEVLWHEVDSRLALGAELNYARQRDFDMLFSFQDHDIVTGHLSGYYDFSNGFTGRIDAGRYLAGDWGATVALSRRFGNGIEVGGFATLTDVPFSEFGEGSFDKGITLEIPLSVLTGQPSRRVLARTIRPVLRDGGARLSVPNRLYGLVEPYRANSFEDEWSRVFR